jgi:hypothetical protein
MILIVLTSISLILAATMGAVAWRLAREERRRSDARVAALASDLGDLELRPAAVTTSGGDLFHLEEPGRSRSRLAVIVPVGAFAIAAALALVVVTSRTGHAVSGPRVSEPARQAGSAPKPDRLRPAPESAPLELIALGHERDGDRIVVRGIVRNPTAGAERTGVAAVVFLFNRDGGFAGSGRASVDVPALAPGSLSPFVVTVPNASEVGRYRVSFRSGENVVPHVDRRQHS